MNDCLEGLHCPINAGCLSGQCLIAFISAINNTYDSEHTHSIWRRWLCS